jgi:hypothetical protein
MQFRLGLCLRVAWELEMPALVSIQCAYADRLYLVSLSLYQWYYLFSLIEIGIGLYSLYHNNTQTLKYIKFKQMKTVRA